MSCIPEFEKLFGHFDKDNSGYIDRDELGTLARALGMNPTEKDIEKLIEESNECGREYCLFKLSLTVSGMYAVTWSLPPPPSL